MIYSTLGWKIIASLRKIRDKFFPHPTRRRKLLDLFLISIKVIAAEGWSSFYFKAKDALKTIKRSHSGISLVNKIIRLKQSLPLPKRIPKRIASKPICKRFALYANSLGNYFFYEIRDILASGIEELGFEVVLRDEKDGFIEDADWHVVIAPHEFFYLGRGKKLLWKKSPRNLILVNNEQPSTQWFSLAYNCFSQAHGIWDINYQSSQMISSKGFQCDYLPLGYVSGFKPFQEVKELPEHYGTCFLEPEIRKASYLNERLALRPIDVLFVGYLSQRRDEFFAKAAPG